MLMLRKSKLTYPLSIGLDKGTSFPKAHDWYGCGRNAARGDENSMLGNGFQGSILRGMNILKEVVPKRC
jgi:hypothetical protein